MDDPGILFDPAQFVDAFRPHTKSSTPCFDLDGRRAIVRVVSVYDGDTLQFVLPMDGDGQKAWRFSARLLGIDACEMRDSDPALRERAVAARDRLVQLVGGSYDCPSSLETAKDIDRFLDQNVCLIHATCGKMDKYGRVLLVVHTPDGRDVAQTLLEEGHAVPYAC